MQLGISIKCGLLGSIKAKSMFILEIKAKQFEDGYLYELISKFMIDKSQGTTLDADYELNYKGRIPVPTVDDLIRKLLAEAHNLQYSIHPLLL